MACPETFPLGYCDPLAGVAAKIKFKCPPLTARLTGGVPIMAGRWFQSWRVATVALGGPRRSRRPARKLYLLLMITRDESRVGGGMAYCGGYQLVFPWELSGIKMSTTELILRASEEGLAMRPTYYIL